MRLYDPSDWYWIVSGSETEVYASARAEYVSSTDLDYLAWIAAGGVPTRIASHEELVDVLRSANVPPYHKVSPYEVVKRLEASGLASDALAALQADPVAYARFFTSPARGGIDADAADVRAFLTNIGADPDAILAP